VSAYNQSVGTLESRVLVSARKLNQLGVVEAGLEAPRLVEETARALSAPELGNGSGQELAAGTRPEPGGQLRPGPRAVTAAG
jgi:DNA recombination protein RmuC